MQEEIEKQIKDACDRLRGKGLFVSGRDSFSMRIPAEPAFLMIDGNSTQPRAVSLADGGEHALIYQHRGDAGAVLMGTSHWSLAIEALGRTPPILFDEHARHLGEVPPLVAAGDLAGLQRALAGGANVAFYGSQCICIGMTRDRVVFNAQLFDKCSLAYVMAVSSGQPIKKIPGWVCWIAGRRLKRDQRRASAAYAGGTIPTGMNAY